jgi:acetyl-CoA C-acetyltransferase
MAGTEHFRDVAVIGVGMIPFGRRDEDTLMDMLAWAGLKALDDAGLGDGGVDALYVANMGSGVIQHQTGLASALVDRLSLLPAAAESIENGPASGASAIKNGLLAIASGYYDTVLVVGGEKCEGPHRQRHRFVATAMTHPTAEYVSRDH